MEYIHTKEVLALKSYVFRLAIEKDTFEDGTEGYHASCPALKGCHTWGHTYEEALTRIKEAVELYVEDLIANGEKVPVDAEQVVEMPVPAVAVNV